MNFARLEKMVREGDMSKDALIYLLHCRTECEWLDYKEDLSFNHDSQLCVGVRLDLLVFEPA